MKQLSPEQNQLIAERLTDTDAVMEVFRKAEWAALQEARFRGVPVAVFRNGKVEHVAAEEVIAEEFPDGL